MNIKILALLFVLIFSSSAYAQYNFKKGYIIALQGDTMQGYINYKEWSRTPTSFLFKSISDEKTLQTYTIYNARKCVIEGYVMYERFEVSVSMNENDYRRLEFNVNPPYKTDTVFLKVIIRGDRITLFAYRDELKDRFYVLASPQTTPVELSIKQEMRGTQVATLYTYRQQLDRIASGYPTYTPELRKLIESASYSKTRLKKIAGKINSVNDKEVASGEKVIKRSSFFINTGLNYSKLTFKGQNLVNANGLDSSGNPAYKNETRTHSYLPVISTGYDFFFHPAIQRSYLRIEVMATAIQSKVTSVYKFPRPYDEELTNKYKFFGVFLSLNPQLVFNILHQHKLKIYAGAGVSFRYAFYPEQTIHQITNKQGPGYSDKILQNYFKMKSFSAVPILHAGAIINKKFRASLTWFKPSELTNVHSSPKESVKERSVQISLAYLF